MRRLSRYLLTLLLAITLLLWLGVIVGWVRSRWRGDAIAFETESAVIPSKDADRGADTQLILQTF